MNYLEKKGVAEMMGFDDEGDFVKNIFPVAY
jgi:hypothetical protein